MAVVEHEVGGLEGGSSTGLLRGLRGGAAGGKWKTAFPSPWVGLFCVAVLIHVAPEVLWGLVLSPLCRCRGPGSW